jgi:hypothetical protein
MLSLPASSVFTCCCSAFNAFSCCIHDLFSMILLCFLFLVLSSLFAVRCLLFAVRCSLFALRSWLFALRCSLSAVRSSLFALCCSLFAVCSSLFILCCSLFAVLLLLEIVFLCSCTALLSRSFPNSTFRPVSSLPLTDSQII